MIMERHIISLLGLNWEVAPSAVEDVERVLPRRFEVIDPKSTAISPRCIGDVFANTIIEHPAFPERAYKLTARECSRMMGVDLIAGMTNEEAQQQAGVEGLMLRKADNKTGYCGVTLSLIHI